MGDPLGNTLVVEVRDLFPKNKVFEERGTGELGLEGVLVVSDRYALVVGSVRLVELTRMRSSGPMDLLVPTVGPPLPTLSDPFTSVLAPTMGSSGTVNAPAGGAIAARLLRRLPAGFRVAGRRRVDLGIGKKRLSESTVRECSARGRVRPQGT